MGYPGRDGARTNEEWEGIINQMIGYIDIMLEDEDDNRMLEAKDPFFDLYSKWFFDLWD